MLIPFLTFAKWLLEQEKRFNNLELRIGKAEIAATEHSVRVAMNEEVCVTMAIHERDIWSDIGKDYPVFLVEKS